MAVYFPPEQLGPALHIFAVSCSQVCIIRPDKAEIFKDFRSFVGAYRWGIRDVIIVDCDCLCITFPSAVIYIKYIWSQGEFEPLWSFLRFGKAR